MEKLAADGDELSMTLVENWDYPVDLMFLTADGALIDKLNSFRDFPDVHPDVTIPPYTQGIGIQGRLSHVDVFLQRVEQFLEQQ